MLLVLALVTVKGQPEEGRTIYKRLQGGPAASVAWRPDT